MASVRVISESAGSLPLHLYSKDGRSRERVTDDPRSRMLSLTPNPDQTAMKLWETVFAHLALWGNAFLLKELHPITGIVSELYALHPNSVTIQVTNTGIKSYKVAGANGKSFVYLKDEVIHIAGFGTGDLGLSAIGYARDMLGTAWAAEEYAGRFFANNARPGGAVQVPGSMNDEQAKEFIRRFEASHKGLSKAQQVALLTNGAT